MWNEADEAEGVDGPEIIVAHGVPKTAWGDGLAVVHVAFGRVVAEDTVDDDAKFPICKPPIGSKPSFCLYG